MINTPNYKKVSKLAYSVIKKFVDNYEDIQDLVQIVTMKYHLNFEKIEKENVWIYATAKNTAIDFMRKNKGSIDKAALEFSDIEDEVTKIILEQKEDSRESVVNILGEYGKNLSKIDRELLEIYLEKSFKIKQIAWRRKLNYPALRKKIYRLKKDIRAEYFRQQGMVGSKKIVGANLHQNLINFIKRFKQAIEENSLGKMSVYLRECKIPIEIPEIEIKKVTDYDVYLLGEHKFQLYVYIYNQQNKFSSFITVFEVYNDNSIKILEFPKQPSKIFALEENNLPIDIIEKLQKNAQGEYDLSEEELEKLIKSSGTDMNVVSKKPEN
ncbi:MAG: sigma-70 family RNA polymerase sigma factor [Armatimonadetes bacterium]|nr:sigma-70 family RNA polymerase sigma factor [Armatimonadota bacterium]